MVRFLVTTIACNYVNYMTLNCPHVHDFHLQHYEILQAMLWKQLKWPTSESCWSGLWVRKRQRERDVKENEWIKTWRAKTLASVKRHNLSFFLVLAWLKIVFWFKNVWNCYDIFRVVNVCCPNLHDTFRREAMKYTSSMRQL